MSANSDQSIWYMQQVIAWQPRLFAFALSLTGNRDEADNVLQNANVAILEKQHAFRPGAQFGAWAMQIGYHEVQRHWAACARSKRRFDNVLLEQLAAKMTDVAAEPGAELQFLRQCMSRLSESEREMLSLRYGGSSVGEIAEKYGRSVGSTSLKLHRVRAKLAECLRSALKTERRDES